MAAIGLTGGAALEGKLREIAQRATTSAELRCGFLEGATYPDGTSVPLVAAVQEFGSPSQHIPSRPFFRTMISTESPHWADDIGKLLLSNDYEAKSALLQMGQEIKEELQDAIKAFDGVPLAPATVAKKGFDKALVDTGHMWQSVDYEVE